MYYSKIVTKYISFVGQLLRKPIIKEMFFAIFSQGLVSLANFMVGFAVAKFAIKSEYGIYVILFSTIGIIGTYQNALINTPLTVLAPKKGPDEKVLFLSGLAFGQGFIFLPVFILTIIATVGYIFIHQEITVFVYVVVLLLASSAFLYREFIRTVNYSMLRINIIFRMDLFFVLLVGVLFGIIIISTKMNSIYAISILGIAGLVSATFGYLYSNDKYHIQRNSIKGALNESWQYSRWATLGVTSDIFKNRGYVYITTAILGLEKVADLSAAALFFTPLRLLVNSTGKIILAKGAELFNIKGIKQFNKFVFIGSFSLMFLGLFYIFFILIFRDYILSFLGEKYMNIGSFVLLWGIYFFIFSMRYPITTALAVLREFKMIAKYDIISAIITTVFCLILIKYIGAYGAIVSSIFGELALLLFAASKFISTSAFLRAKPISTT